MHSRDLYPPPSSSVSSSFSSPPTSLDQRSQQTRTSSSSRPSCPPSFSSSRRSIVFKPPSLSCIPTSSSFSPVILPLSDKPIPSYLSNTLHPTALLTNLWISISLSSTPLSSDLMYLIARSLPFSEYTGVPSQPVVIRLKNPACTAILQRTGRLSIMGGLTPDQATWQAYRLAYRIKYRTQWEFFTPSSSSQRHKKTDTTQDAELSSSSSSTLVSSGTLPKTSQRDLKSRFLFSTSLHHLQLPSSSSSSSSFSQEPLSPSLRMPPLLQIRYVPLHFIRFSPQRMRIQQMVCCLDLGGGSFSPDLERIERHSSLQGRVLAMKDGVTIRIPLEEAKTKNREISQEEVSRDDGSRSFSLDREKINQKNKKMKMMDSPLSAGVSLPKKTWGVVQEEEEEEDEEEEDEEDEDYDAIAAKLFAGRMNGEEEEDWIEEEEEGQEGSEGVGKSRQKRRRSRTAKGESPRSGKKRKKRSCLDEEEDSDLLEKNGEEEAFRSLRKRGRKPQKRCATCIVYRTGRILVLGCRCIEEIDSTVTYIWPSLVDL
ncbi:hypothetical protein CSUI_009328 [Cystoisospora suis]|uniref:Uncharacterized protein n=1 Tax=Cystoisospora suis TaxID=483139 RepID=A0A2C6KK52_9APIC|nr:hypothetical protein CSUI_009328 [Cystoisospora suis]